MNTVAVTLLSVAAMLGAVLWYVVEHRRVPPNTPIRVAAAVPPVVLVSAAALFGLSADRASDVLLSVGTAAAVVAAVTGGSLVATAFLYVADPMTETIGITDTKDTADTPEPTGDAETTADAKTTGTTDDTSVAETIETTLAAGIVSSIAAPGGISGPGAMAGLSDADRGGDATATVSNPETLRGGTSIGVLERAAVAVTLLAGWPEGLALVLGGKGLGRYPELSRPAAAERFIIGTLASVLWAVATVGAAYTLRS